MGSNSKTQHDLCPAKRGLFLALEDLPHATGAPRAIGVALLLLIVVNALMVGIDEGHYQAAGVGFFFVFNVFSTVAFGVEYLCRLWIADAVYPGLSPVRARIRYALSAFGLIDLFSFLPMLFFLAAPYSASVANAVRIVRLLRLLKITRYMRGLKAIGAVFHKRQSEIVAAFTVVALLCIAASVLMYAAEHAAQPDAFDSIFTGLYWAMTTMTSTGYGDLVPITPLGRLIGFITMTLSIAVVAIPAGIFSAGFVAEFRSNDAVSGEDVASDEDAAHADAAANADDATSGEDAVSGNDAASSDAAAHADDKEEDER